MHRLRRPRLISLETRHSLRTVPTDKNPGSGANRRRDRHGTEITRVSRVPEPRPGPRIPGPNVSLRSTAPDMHTRITVNEDRHDLPDYRGKGY